MIQKLKEILHKKINACKELGNMEKEKWAFEECLRIIDKLQDER